MWWLGAAVLKRAACLSFLRGINLSLLFLWLVIFIELDKDEKKNKHIFLQVRLELESRFRKRCGRREGTLVKQAANTWVSW